MPARGDLIKMVFGGLALLVIGLLAGRAIPQAPTVEAVSVTFPGGGAVELTTSAPEVSHESLLEEMFADGSTRNAVVDWLRARDFFSLDDDGLVDAIGTRLCDPIPDSPLARRTAAARECADGPLASGLRDLAERRAVPFHSLGRTVRVAIPEDRPPRGSAAVCEGSELHGERVELTSDSGDSLVVDAAWGTYSCTEVEGAEYPDIQINPFDAFEIFPRPLARFHEAVALIVD